MADEQKTALRRLGELVATPSISSTDPSWDQGNRAVVDRLAEWATDIGFRCEIQPVNADGSKANLIATLGSGPGGLVLAGHTDTVPYDAGRWQRDPLALTEDGGRLYGLGSTDMKGFFPLVLAAAARFAGKQPDEPLILLATADEESSMSGARALVDAGRPRARAAIVGEPTSLVPVRMHKGITMQSVIVSGQAGHSSNPALGNSALEGMHEVVGELLAFRELLRERYSHPLFAVAFPTLNLGCIHGGDSPNRICARAELHFDLRMTPRGQYEEVLAEIGRRLDAIAARRGLDIAFKTLVEPVPPFEQPEHSEIVEVAQRLTGHRAESVAFATEAPFFSELGMQTIVLGPGNIDRAHQPDEYIDRDQLGPCIDLLEGAAAHYCFRGTSATG
jgi:acetylornithine deacetylase